MKSTEIFGLSKGRPIRKLRSFLRIVVGKISFPVVQFWTKID